MAKKRRPKKKTSKGVRQSRYSQVIAEIFFSHYKRNCTEFNFDRDDIERAAKAHRIKNLGDVLYSFRYRSKYPQAILETEPKGKEWVIRLAGHGQYRFVLARINRVIPTPNAYQIKIPDATPELISSYAKTDEQALLAKVRYNRLIDIFLRVTAHSLQSHLRTSVPELGQIEVDELYVGVRNTGQQFIIPVQAKGGRDQIGATQVWQDLELCKYAYPELTPRAVAVQFGTSGEIAMFELAFQGDDLKVVDEKQYRLVPGAEIHTDDLKQMAKMSD